MNVMKCKNSAFALYNFTIHRRPSAVGLLAAGCMFKCIFIQKSESLWSYLCWWPPRPPRRAAGPPQAARPPPRPAAARSGTSWTGNVTAASSNVWRSKRHHLESKTEAVWRGVLQTGLRVEVLPQRGPDKKDWWGQRASSPPTEADLQWAGGDIYHRYTDRVKGLVCNELKWLWNVDEWKQDCSGTWGQEEALSDWVSPWRYIHSWSYWSVSSVGFSFHTNDSYSYLTGCCCYQQSTMTQ